MAVALADISSISSFDRTWDATTSVEDGRDGNVRSAVGMDVQGIFETLIDPAVTEEGVEGNGDYEKAQHTLHTHFLPQVNILFERHIFPPNDTKKTETVDQFVSRLTQQAANCNFQDLERENIRDQVIHCYKNKSLRGKLLEKGTGLTLATEQQIARAMETVDPQA